MAKEQPPVFRTEWEQIRTFSYLHSAAEWAVETAEGSRDKEMFPSMLAILATAAFIEAFMNHLGPCFFNDKWDSTKANLRDPSDKVKALLAHLSISVSSVRPSYDAFSLCLRMRNSIVHGRTHEVSRTGQPRRSPGAVLSKAKPEWLRLCTPKKARHLLSKAEHLVEVMAESAGISRLCYMMLGSGFGWMDRKAGGTVRDSP